MKFAMKSTRIVPIVLVLTLLAFSPAQAEFIGLNIGLQQTSPTLFGNPSNHSSFDLVDDLAIEDSPQSSMVLILEHPISALPNIRYTRIDLNYNSTTTIEEDESLDGNGLSNPDETRSSFDLSQNDIVLYYQLGDASIDLDLGANLKRFDGQITTYGESGYSVEVDETIPLFYLSARYQLPNSGFYIGADINSSILDLGLSESSAEDTMIKLGYESDSGLGVEGGYKYYSLDLDYGGSQDTELEYDGFFLNGYYNF